MRTGTAGGMINPSPEVRQNIRKSAGMIIMPVGKNETGEICHRQSCRAEVGEQSRAGTGIKEDMMFSVPDRKSEPVFRLPWRRHMVVNKDGNGCHFVFPDVLR